MKSHLCYWKDRISTILTSDIHWSITAPAITWLFRQTALPSEVSDFRLIFFNEADFDVGGKNQSFLDQRERQTRFHSSFSCFRVCFFNRLAYSKSPANFRCLLFATANGYALLHTADSGFVVGACVGTAFENWRAIWRKLYA